MVELTPFLLTFALALLTTVMLVLAGLPLAYWLSSTKWRGGFLLEALVSLPLVLPPSVLGFYLLLAFSPDNAFGKFLDEYLDLRFVFTFEGLVVASMIYSFPFMIQPLLSGFRALSPSLAETSYTLGKGKVETFFRVILPNTKASVVTACILTFAHTVGEFGVVLIIGGNIPSETRVVSVAVYDEVEAMNYQAANWYSLILLFFSFFMLIIIYWINGWLNKKKLAND